VSCNKTQLVYVLCLHLKQQAEAGLGFQNVHPAVRLSINTYSHDMT